MVSSRTGGLVYPGKPASHPCQLGIGMPATFAIVHPRQNLALRARGPFQTPFDLKSGKRDPAAMKGPTNSVGREIFGQYIHTWTHGCTNIWTMFGPLSNLSLSSLASLAVSWSDPGSRLLRACSRIARNFLRSLSACGQRQNSKFNSELRKWKRHAAAYLREVCVAPVLLPGGAEVLPQVVVLVKLAVVADANSRSVATAACGREGAIELSPKLKITTSARRLCSLGFVLGS